MMLISPNPKEQSFLFSRNMRYFLITRMIQIEEKYYLQIGRVNNLSLYML